MSILDTIIVDKFKEAAALKETTSIDELKQQSAAARPLRGFVKALRSTAAPAVIAEIKRSSPSRGRIRPDLDPEQTAQSYQQNGAACISVLTDEKYFEGSLEFLRAIDAKTTCPLLRKDFMVDPIQIWQSRAAGADAILLIVAALKDELLGQLFDEASEAGLDVLIEVHNRDELARVADLFAANPARAQHAEHTLIGVNNRNLHNFVTDIQVSVSLLGLRSEIFESKGVGQLLEKITFISESGMRSAADLQTLSQADAAGFLIGEFLVEEGDPGENLRQLREQAQALL